MAVHVSLKHNSTGEIRPSVVGFSWTSLVFGFFVPLLRGDIGYGIIMFLVALVVGGLTAGIGDIFLFLYQAFTYNKRGMRLLSEKGFMPADESSRNTLKAYGIVFEKK